MTHTAHAQQPPITRVVLLIERGDGVQRQVTQIAGADRLIVSRPRLRFLRRLRPRLVFTLVNPGKATTFEPAFVVAPAPVAATDWETHINAIKQFDRRNVA